MRLSKYDKKRFSRNYKSLDEALHLCPAVRRISRMQVTLLGELNRSLMKQNPSRRVCVDDIGWNIEYSSSRLLDLSESIEALVSEEKTGEVYPFVRRVLMEMRSMTAGLRMESLVADISEEPLLTDLARGYMKEAAHLMLLFSCVSDFEEFKDQLEAWSIYWFGFEGHEDQEIRDENALELWQARPRG